MSAPRRIASLVAVAGFVALATWSGGVRMTAAGAQIPASVVDRTASVPADGDREALRQRVAAFWAARVEGDARAQWELLEPRGRGRLAPADYAPAQGVVKYLAYQVEDASVEGYFARVTVRLLVRTTLPSARQVARIVPSHALLKDRWVRIGGVWYRALEQGEQGEQEGQ